MTKVEMTTQIRTRNFDPSSTRLWELKDWIMEQPEGQEAIASLLTSKYETLQRNFQRLFYDDQELLPHCRNLKEYSFLHDNATITMLIQGNDLEVKFDTGNGDETIIVPFEMAEDVTVLKEKIRKIFSNSIPLTSDGVSFALTDASRGHVLDDSGRTMKGKLSGYSHRLRINPFVVTTKLLDGTSFEVWFHSQFTLQDLWSRINNHFEIPPDKQLLLRCGDKTLHATRHDLKLMESGINLHNDVLFVINKGIAVGSPWLPVSQDKTRGCDILRTELRCLTLHQLKQLAAEIILRCQKEGWTSTNPSQQGK
ncbi:expressed unknown protein [Seminavis robusta]|uniref:Ubiquitin-like domain-containing protein n=1 Tax=Seminavis robusta TaxID=568900 RepID=A0A9N8HEF5_9STRA|nr:expressed unknown protein [Seminavis robusta]|eukprot:Sro513_g157770.1 n/a (310) ;mRNA; r:13092-14088